MQEHLSISTGKPGFTGELPPSDFNLTRYCIHKSAKTTPDKTALVIIGTDGVESWTYRQIETRILSMAAGLQKMGLRKADRLFIRMGNCFDYALVFFAANAAGMVPIPASSQLTAKEVSFLLEDATPAAIATDGTLPIEQLPSGIKLIDHDAIKKLKQNQPQGYSATRADDPAFLIYTSGTTSHPKGVLHAQRTVWGRRPMYRDWYDICANDRLLHAGAFNWTYTLGTGLFDPWANGATSIICTAKTEPASWPHLIRQHKASIFAAVPSLYRRILKYADSKTLQMPTLRHGLTAGEPQPASIEDQWHQTTGTRLYEALGMSEISTYISTSPKSNGRQGSPGKPQTGRSIAILPQTGSTKPVARNTTGVIGVHRTDPGLMLGYWKRPIEEQAMYRGNWFITGDTASMDDDGYIWFTGRNDDMMNAMGYRVSPVEVEAVLCNHPNIHQAGVVQVNLANNVSIMAAFLVCHGDKPDIEDVRAHAKKYLAAYKVPHEYHFIPRLPHTASGKIKRSQLRDQISASLS